MRSFVLFFSLCFLSACGNSPILNHKDAPSVQKSKEGTQAPGASASSNSGSSSGSGEQPTESSTQPIDRRCDLKFVKLNICGTVTWTQPPFLGGAAGNELGLEIWDLTTKANRDLSYDLRLQPWMVEHGHGVKRKPKVVKGDGVGRLTVSNIFFSMEGNWELRFFWMDGETLVDQAKLDLSF